MKNVFDFITGVPPDEALPCIKCGQATYIPKGTPPDTVVCFECNAQKKSIRGTMGKELKNAGKDSDAPPTCEGVPAAPEKAPAGVADPAFDKETNRMKLECAGSISSIDVTDAEIRSAFKNDHDRGEFIILSKEDQVFLQAAGESDGPYTLEFREGSDEQHFQCERKLNKVEVESVFLKYLSGDTTYKADFKWSLLNSTDADDRIIDSGHKSITSNQGDGLGFFIGFPAILLGFYFHQKYSLNVPLTLGLILVGFFALTSVPRSISIPLGILLIGIIFCQHIFQLNIMYCILLNLALAVACLIYSTPSLIALRRNHYYKWPIVIINIAFGWSLIGWVGSCIWAVWPNSHPDQ